MTEYLELGFLDFMSMNVYLHREDSLRRYLARLSGALQAADKLAA